jgi:hypothetical protein
VASSAPWQTLTISSGPESRLDAFNDGIKSALIGGGINQREAVDQAAVATEHHLLVESLAPTVSGQDKPITSQRTVVNGEVRVGMALHIVLVACDRLAAFIGKGANQQFGLTVGTGEDGAVSRLRRSLGGNNASSFFTDVLPFG